MNNRLLTEGKVRANIKIPNNSARPSQPPPCPCEALKESPMTLKVGETLYVRADLVDAALPSNYEDDKATLVLAQLLGKQA
jgi:hypothetical protein